jgi:hypothetical protein
MRAVRPSSVWAFSPVPGRKVVYSASSSARSTNRRLPLRVWRPVTSATRSVLSMATYYPVAGDRGRDAGRLRVDRAPSGHPNGVPNPLLVRAVGRLPGLRRLPLFKLVALAQVAILAREHVTRLEPDERRRLVDLVRRTRAGRRPVSEEEREELAALVAKADPRRFAGLAADRLSPVPLPRRLVHGSRR